jgi:hypothetical protein
MKNDMKPFNIEHAKAGAPYGYLDGTTAEILKFDILGPYPIISSKYFTSDCTPVKIVISKYDF